MGKGKGKLRQWQESHLSHLSLSSLFLACRFRQSSADNVERDKVIEVNGLLY
jgi:hypothetical protein